MSDDPKMTRVVCCEFPYSRGVVRSQDVDALALYLAGPLFDPGLVNARIRAYLLEQLGIEIVRDPQPMGYRFEVPEP